MGPDWASPATFRFGASGVLDALVAALDGRVLEPADSVELLTPAVLPQEVIRLKRDGGELPAAEIEQFVAGLVDGAVSEGQAAALAMAIYFNGMVLDERVALTLAMTRSGAVLAWDDLDGPVVDKHSTGGVGDTVSLMLAPAVAACGAFVPMISGRGLGHTGGTLDKMSSIPGYDAMPDRETFRRVVRDVGCAIIGQTDDLAPADKRLYAIRDVTATVESVPLITASILSKKLAAGLDGLAMDVKFGNGAFMASREDAQELADALVEVAVGAGLPTSAGADGHEPAAGVGGRQRDRGRVRDRLPHRRPARTADARGRRDAGRRDARAGIAGHRRRRRAGEDRGRPRRRGRGEVRRDGHRARRPGRPR